MFSFAVLIVHSEWAVINKTTDCCTPGDRQRRSSCRQVCTGVCTWYVPGDVGHCQRSRSKSSVSRTDSDWCTRHAPSCSVSRRQEASAVGTPRAWHNHIVWRRWRGVRRFSGLTVASQWGPQTHSVPTGRNAQLLHSAHVVQGLVLIDSWQFSTLIYVFYCIVFHITSLVLSCVLLSHNKRILYYILVHQSLSVLLTDDFDLARWLWPTSPGTSDVHTPGSINE